MAGINGVSTGTEANEYEKVLQDQIREAENAEKAKLQLQYKYADEEKKLQLTLKMNLKQFLNLL